MDATTATSGGGSYSFTGVTAREHTECGRSYRSGRTQTTVNPADVVVTRVTLATGADFGSFAQAAISGFLAFDDLDGDGNPERRRAGALPPSPSSWTRAPMARSTRPRQQAAAGVRQLHWTRAGDVPPCRAGRTGRVRDQTTTNPADIVLGPAADHTTGVDFRSSAAATITGLAFDDLDGNGTQDRGRAAARGRDGSSLTTRRQRLRRSRPRPRVVVGSYSFSRA